MILVTGFGPFLKVSDNPSGRLALSLDGRTLAGHKVVGRVLPVSYERAPALTLALVGEQGVFSLVLGTGVATTRTTACVESVAHAECGQQPDVDGQCMLQLGHKEVASTLDAARLADCLGAELSSDAGGYVCNAWLYRVAAALPQTAVGFVHVPSDGVAVEPFAAGLERFLAQLSSESYGA